MKILLVITKGNFGGAQRYLCDVASGMIAKGDYVTVAFGEPGLLAGRLAKLGISNLILPRLARDPSPVNDLRAIFDLRRLFHEEQPDVVHLNSSKAGFLGAIAARTILRNRPKVVFTVHGWPFNEKRSMPVRSLYYILSMVTVVLSDAVICVSGKALSDLRPSFMRRRATVIHNGIRPAVYEPPGDEIAQRVATERARRKFLIATIAELHKNKGLDSGMLTLKFLRDAGVPGHWFIFGEGEERTRLEEGIRETGLDEHVTLFGYVQDASRYLPKFDVFFLPSRTEAFPYVLLEAASSGLPSVARAVGGIPELVVQDVTGLLGENDRELGAHLERLARDTSLRGRLGAAAKEKVSHFSLDRMIEATRCVYALAGRGGRVA
ncbi:MAG TPA: glycosyltransferase [Woeseiaceae bacterium]|nr:glycosyltransferase [Woeseiaceae bacterium]